MLVDFFGVLVFLLFAVVTALFLDDFEFLFGFGVFVYFPLFEEVEVFELPVVFGARVERRVFLVGLFIKEQFLLNLIWLLDFDVFIGGLGLAGAGN